MKGKHEVFQNSKKTTMCLLLEERIKEEVTHKGNQVLLRYL